MYNVLSILLGRLLCKVFKLPRWTIPAIAFNNTTSFPLLLIQSLEATPVLSRLVGPGEETSDAVTRARTYFLVSAVVSHALTFGIGGGELKGDDEDASQNGKDSSSSSSSPSSSSSEQERYRDDPSDEESSAPQTSLLPSAVHHHAHRLHRGTHAHTSRLLARLPSPISTVIRAIATFLTPPLIGGILGAIIGLTPPLQALFFNPSTEGGYLNAWLTQSIKNVGQLFVTLQVVVVGVKLAEALRREKRGESGTGTLEWGPVATVAGVRYIVWPAYVLVPPPFLFG